MARGDVTAFLSNVPLFEGFSKADLKKIVKEANEDRFGPKTPIVTEGESGGRFFLILEGQADLVIGGRKRRGLGPGDHFGEMSILDKGPRSASVIAASEVRTLSIASWNFLSMLQEDFRLAKKVMIGMSRRIRELDRSLA